MWYTMENTVFVSIDDLKSKIETILCGVGLTKQDAQVVADALLDAEISGVASHGITRLKAYVDRIVCGNISTKPDIVIQENGASLQVSGGNGLGQVVMCRAIDRCLEIAKEYGVAVAAVEHSNHFGTAAFYANRIAKEHCIGFVATNAGSTMAPFGGLDLLLGTNPFAIAFPSEKQVFCADMATSAVAKGKIRIFQKEGKAIPLGWALDAEGQDTTDPAAAIKGILLPMGGHKGYALAMAVDAVCGLLSGANLSCEAPSMFETQIPANTGHFILVLDIAHFMDVPSFEKRAQSWFDMIRGSRHRSGMEIMIPGEPESRKREKCEGMMEVLSESLATVQEYYTKYATK